MASDGSFVNFKDFLDVVTALSKGKHIDLEHMVPNSDGTNSLYVSIRSNNGTSKYANPVIYRSDPKSVFDKLSPLVQKDCIFSVSAGYSQKSSTVEESHLYLLIMANDVDCADKLHEML